MPPNLPARSLNCLSRGSQAGRSRCAPDGPVYLGIVSWHTGPPEVVLSRAWLARLQAVNCNSPPTSAWIRCACGRCRVPVAIVGVKADSVLRYQPADWAPIRMDNGAQGGGLAPIRVVDIRAVLVEVPDEGISVNGRQ